MPLEVAGTLSSNLCEVDTTVAPPFNGANINQNNIYEGSQGRSKTILRREDLRWDIDAKLLLQKMRLNCKNNLIIAHLNINSIRNKFDLLKELISNNIDILVISETKLDPSFPPGQFYIDGYMSPIRADRNRYGGGLLIYIKEGIPAKEVSLKCSTAKEIEAKAIEINLHKIKWLLIGIYRPPSQSKDFFLEEMRKNIEQFYTKYENFLMIGDFNLNENDSSLYQYMQEFNLENVVKVPTCFKSDSPTCIDLILTSDKRKLANSRAIETGLSDFHAMVVTTLKGSFHKKGPRIITYRDYSKFDNHVFREKVGEELNSKPLMKQNFNIFDSSVKSILNEQAPLKKKYLRANDGPFMTKELRKANMKRTRLKNCFNKTRTNENWAAFKRQRNLCVKILRQNKRSYYAQLDPKVVSDNKRFWKTVKPLFSNKIQSSTCIALLENGIVESDEGKVAEILNNYFVNITETLGIADEHRQEPLNDHMDDPCLRTVKRFQEHPSIHKIKSSVKSTINFSFRKITVEEMLEQLQNLDPKKGSPQEAIPAKILKSNADLFCFPLTELFNKLVEESSFPDDLKNADVSSLFKKDDNMSKKNYRPISLLPSIAKIFERLMHKQLSEFTERFFSPLLGGFRQGYNTQHVLLNFLQYCKNSIDNRGLAGAVFMDLSKAFDCVNHGLLIAKLSAYGLNMDALQLIRSYLSNRQQRVKINSSFSDWKEIKIGVPQGSVLGPLLFNVFINDIFWFANRTKICNYADDTTIFACHPDLDNIIKQLEEDSTVIVKWFSDNFLKLNDDKCRLMIFGGKSTEATVTIGNSKINESDYEKLLGVTFDKKLSFKKHVEDLYKKANQKLHALARLSNYIDPIKSEILMNSFIRSQFNYCPLVWMFHDRATNSKLNRIQERALRMVCKDSESGLADLKNKYGTIHQHNLQLLMIEIFKTKNNLNPTFMKKILTERDIQYNLRNGNHLGLPKVNTTSYGIENIQYRGHHLWSSLPREIKDSNTLVEFKRKIKLWHGNTCICRLCKIFVKDLGFL